MELLVKANDYIKDIQSRFNQHYPHLQIRFYNKEHSDLAGSPKSLEISNEVQISELNSEFEQIHVSISGNRQVTDIETDFETMANLHVQIFRKSGALWLQTSTTDHWTLTEQEEKGKLSE